MCMKIGSRALFLAVVLLLSVSFAFSASEGTVNSNVTINVSDDEVADTPSAPAIGGGGSGGSGIVFQYSDFSLSKDLIKVKVKQGESIREIIIVTNTGTRVITIDKIKVEDVSDFMAISEKSFTLFPGESKNVLIDIFAKDNEFPDAYTGSILFESESSTKKANVIVEVKERSPLFDISAKLAKTQLIPGENIVAEIIVINMGDLDEIDIVLFYAIKNFEGKVIASRDESLAIKKEIKVTRQLNVPSDIEIGSYVFYAGVTHKEVRAASSEKFEVVDFALSPIVGARVWIYILLIILAIILIVLYFIWKKRKKKKAKRMVVEKEFRVKSVPLVLPRKGNRIVYTNR
jgi:uncharacterized membrane protein